MGITLASSESAHLQSAVSCLLAAGWKETVRGTMGDGMIPFVRFDPPKPSPPPARDPYDMVGLEHTIPTRGESDEVGRIDERPH